MTSISPNVYRAFKGGGTSLLNSMASCPSYSLASIKPPLRGRAFPPVARRPPLAARPPMRPTFLAPRCRGLLAAFYARRCRAATLAPRSASRRSGDGRPRFGHGPAARAAGRGLRRGLAIPRPAVTPAASTAGLRVELARWRSLALRLGRCPRREDRRGSSRRSAALFRPEGFGWGRARISSPKKDRFLLLQNPIHAYILPNQG